MQNKYDEDTIQKALELSKAGLSSREIAAALNVGSKSTVNNWLSRYDGSKPWVTPSDTTWLTPCDSDFSCGGGMTNLAGVDFTEISTKDVFKIETSQVVGTDVTHLMIPDTQCKPDIDMTYLDILGQYIVDKQPEVIVHIGDHADMPSLSSYDKGMRTAEGKRVQLDIEASIEGMNRLLRPLYELQQKQKRETGMVKYKPKMVLTLGNHEERIMRHVNANPELHGFLSYDSLRYEDFGWEVHDYLKPVVINGVAYVHFLANPMSGKPYGGTALNILKNVGESFCMGHKQCLDVATRFLPASGVQQWGIIAGAYYDHEESYKGHQGNHHWRGIVVKHNVNNGTFNPMFVSLDYLKQRYKSV